MKVKFSDVVRRANTKEDRFNTDKEFYVGGEHMITGEYLITRRGTIAGSNIGPMFYFGFKKGQVLLASRSPDLKKAGMVTFDGICSEKTFVIETKDESVLLQDFLPAIVRSEKFWKYANDNQSGSVNHFINWTTFANYEFDLPDIETQRKLSTLLWAMERTKTAYKNLIAKTDELVKSQFVEMFQGDEYPLIPIGNLLRQRTTTERIVDTLQEKYVTIGLHGKGVRERSIAHYDPKPFSAYRVSSGQFIYSRIDARNGAFGIIPQNLDGAVVSKDFPVFDIDYSKITVDYLMYSVLSDDFIQQIKLNSIGTTNRQRVNEEALLSYKIKLPTISEQNQFAAFIEQTDKSKFAAQQALADLTAAQKALMWQYLG